MKRAVGLHAVLALSLVLGSAVLSGGSATAGTSSLTSGPTPSPIVTQGATADRPTVRSAVDEPLRDRVLPTGWRTSNDRALATAGDTTGFHVLIAEANSGYQWRTLATLSEPGMDTDQWIGNACMTGTGDRVVAVYAPRHFTNRATLFNRGAFAAIIEISTGEVTKLKDQVSVAYFNPGCGADGKAVLTQGSVEGHNTTRLLVVDTAQAKVTRRSVVSGQLTSAVPVAGAVLAAAGARLVEVSETGKLTTVATTSSAPFDLHPDREGGLTYAEHADGQVTVRYHKDKTTRALATGPLGLISIRAGTDGRVFVLGEARTVSAMPAAVSVLAAPGDDAGVSSHGELVILSAAGRSLRPTSRVADSDTRIQGTGHDDGAAAVVDLAALVPATRSRLSFAVEPAARISPKSGSGRAPNPRLLAAGLTTEAGSNVTASAEDPVDQGYSCAVPRNDPRTQVYQPHWRQVEWAVDQLVFRRLTVTRWTDWKKSGLQAWSPQTLFPAEDLKGTTGGRVPTNVMFGILAQESNLWQAQRNVVEGETGNPLIGNYYGVNVYDADPSNDWAIDFSKADCGYGITQMTDGMRRAGYERPGERLFAPDVQRKIALDYVTNIAAGLQVLTKKWNEIWQDTGGQAKINNGDPARIENWYLAVWAYNSGWHPKSAAWGVDSNGVPNNGAWGVGWANNPSNPSYRPGRRPFLDNNSYADAAHPQDWPYQEKVLGWAAWPIAKDYYDTTAKKWMSQPGYNAAWWNTSLDRGNVVPSYAWGGGTSAIVVDVNAFCVPSSAGGDDHNNCRPDTGSIPAPGTCQRDDSKCWWHLPKVWKPNCSSTCGNEGTIRYDSMYAGIERSEPTDYWYPCVTPGLPSGALIVDDVPSSVPPVRGDCDNSPWTNSGGFAFEFGRDANGRTPAKADFQQLGNGFGGHEWFAYTRDSAHDGDVFKVTGTWTLNQPVNGWARVFVHLPARRAWSQRAPYTVGPLLDPGNGAVTQTRTLPQRLEANTWVSLGVFQFSGTPYVSLTNWVANHPGDGDPPQPFGNGATAIAWDAVAFQKLPGKPRNIVVAMGDSYSSGEGLSRSGGVDYYRDSDNNGTAQRADDPNHPRQLAGDPRFRNACHRSKFAWSRMGRLTDSTNSIGARADSWDANMDYHLIACAGAETENVLPFGERNAFGDAVLGQYGELSQIDKGFLDRNTTLVTLGIGGNDTGFGPIIQTCLIHSLPCYAAALPEFGFAPLSVTVPERINGKVRDSIIQTLRAIHREAPNAKILLMGYPIVVGAPCGPPGGQVIDQDEVDWTRNMANLMNQVLLALPSDPALAGITLKVADPRPYFGLNGEHGACTGDGNEAIHELVTDLTPGDDALLGGRWNLPGKSAQSFHPNLELGAGMYTQTFNSAALAPGL
ncbi:GDSL-type esterase/lipase family protein [Nonomuraea jiangxiensis]|uniref:GDSL-like Lipase/Acylhydrolase family protein n=1 Tax=Nonomuraea jiangxiensis TaxID=633440 RepID=A0A1G9WFD9_9ACTN|nr:GDSL-type esterase/lipase family protein [Nonomuraea jiangxiensis]SDM82745.1 GDSL-like Lipase/Acylhydrolase family protein [Nonomuraea jiangxiensis]